MSSEGATPAEGLSLDEELLLARIPPPPREIPAWFRNRELGGARVVLGAVIALMGLVALAIAWSMLSGGARLLDTLSTLGFGLLFGLVGFALFRNARRTGKRHVRAVEHGIAVLATVTASEPDISISVNRRNPWQISYVFFLDNVAFHGSLSTWNVDRAKTIAKGARVGVVYLEGSPGVNCLYPPL